MVPPSTAPRPVVLIQPTRSWAALRLGDLWEYRELLYFLIWRDVKVRYKQTLLGAFWAVFQPLATMLAFSVFFHGLANVPSADAIPYPIFAFVGLLPWQLFSRAMSQSSMSLLNSSGLIRKVYFPRAIIPLAGAIGPLVDVGISLLVLAAMMVYYGVVPGSAILLLPLFLGLALITALGVGLWLSALSVRYRDVSHLVPFLIQFWLFATPVAYPSNLLSEPWHTLYGLNPMAGVVEGFRWAMLNMTPPSSMILVSCGVSVALLVSGLVYFRQIERGFADVI